MSKPGFRHGWPKHQAEWRSGEDGQEAEDRPRAGGRTKEDEREIGGRCGGDAQDAGESSGVRVRLASQTPSTDSAHALRRPRLSRRRDDVLALRVAANDTPALENQESGKRFAPTALILTPARDEDIRRAPR